MLNSLLPFVLLDHYQKLQLIKLNQKSSYLIKNWQHESFDRVIRDAEELESTIRYVLNNPVKAGLVDEWQDWPFSYCKSKFKTEFM